VKSANRKLVEEFTQADIGITTFCVKQWLDQQQTVARRLSLEERSEEAPFDRRWALVVFERARDQHLIQTTLKRIDTTMTKRIRQLTCALCACVAAAASIARAQIDPEPRSFLNLGFSQSLRDYGPSAAYAFWYWNQPHVPWTNTTLRLAIAPVFVDGELAFKELLGENTDLGVGFFGGGFFNSYKEVRQGNYYPDESFNGNGGGGAVSIYHIFNPGATVPLNGILRGSVNYHAFSDTHDTANNFQLPNSQPFVTLRTGLRWGGIEPILFPRLAMEVSGWYELEYRPWPGAYGFNGDRDLNTTSQRFLGRALLSYTMPRSEHYIILGLVGGAVIDADRFSAYRVGGALRFTSEFPLYLPGYYYQELSAKSFGLLYGMYSIPLGEEKKWNVMAGGATSVMDYVDGLEQPGNWNSSVIGGLGYTAKNRRWRALSTFGYGIDAIRSGGRGGYSVALMFYYNFGRQTSFASDRAFQDLQRSRSIFRLTE
jgi:hypothetical protein